MCTRLNILSSHQMYVNMKQICMLLNEPNYTLFMGHVLLVHLAHSWTLMQPHSSIPDSTVTKQWCMSLTE